MSMEIDSSLGKIDVSNEAIATIAGDATVNCYGLVGMASRQTLKDGFTEMLGKGNLSRGVVVRNEDDKIEIDLYIIVSYGVKISEVAYNVQTKVKYTLNQILGLDISGVNVYIQGVRVSEP